MSQRHDQADHISSAFYHYIRWNTAICRHFFNRQRSGQPVYLQVDADTLRDIAPRVDVPPEEAEQAFANAVRVLLSPQSKSNVFGLIDRRVQLSRDSTDHKPSDPPFFIALLGLCVLAAGRMHKDDVKGIGGNNYYVWLNDLIGRDSRGSPPGFDKVTGYWEDLRKWLDVENGGELGICTATTSDWFWMVGYPISQCLLRASDRACLPDFFKFAGIAPGDELNPEELLGPLERWCSRQGCTFSAHARRLVAEGNKQVRLNIARIATLEARYWTGETVTEEGQHAAPIVLHIVESKRYREFELDFYPTYVRGFPVGTFSSSVGGTLELKLDDDKSPWYEPIPINPKMALDQGIELRSGNYKFAWTPSLVIPFKRDTQDLGGWVSHTRAQLNDPILVLCSTRATSFVEYFLQRYAVQGWRRAPGTHGLPVGWVAYVDVTIDSVAQPGSYWEELEPLVPEQRTSLSLVGGLKLDSSTWLAGAEPTLRVSQPSNELLDILVDGISRLRDTASHAELDLSALNLEAGSHSIVAKGWNRNLFTTTSGKYRPLPTLSNWKPKLVNVVLRHGAEYSATFPSPRFESENAPPPGQVWVLGAKILARPEDHPNSLPMPTQLPGTSKIYYLLGPQPGMVIQCSPPPHPATPHWIEVEPVPFEVIPPFQIAWIVSVSQKRHWRVRPASKNLPPPIPTPYEGAAPDMMAEWKRLLLKKYRRPMQGETAALWREYVRLASSLDG